MSMPYDQNTQKEADIPGGIEDNNDKLVDEIMKMVDRPEIEPSKHCRIYKVPHPLRKWNEEAYTPQVVSIGPFHHNNERLKAMEEHKVTYLRSFMIRSGIRNLMDLVRIIRHRENRIRGCYEETINLNSNGFVKMILVDASFILELFFRYKSGSWTSDDPIFVEPRANAIRLDLLLLENQLPFFVFEDLLQLAFPPCIDYIGSLLELSVYYFGRFNIQSIQAYPNVEIEHFTDLIRTFQLPPAEMQLERPRQMIQNLYSAAQLHEAGLKFEVGKSNCYFDIKLEKGVLKIPRFELHDWTEIVMRNIMALEQIRYTENAYVTGYFLFMDSLIKTGKDVDLLCEKTIWVNYLNDSDAAKSLTYNLNKGIICMRGYYSNLSEELNSFYKNPCNRLKALFVRTYFTASDFLYVAHNINIMTLLTIIQTVCCIIQLAGPSSKPN